MIKVYIKNLYNNLCANSYLLEKLLFGLGMGFMLLT